MKTIFLYCWPIQTVYIPCASFFFVCSGFLYQATAPNEWNVKKHIGNIKKKALALGVPYVTFSTITLLLKNVFATDVNNAAPLFLKNTSYRTNRTILVFIYAILTVLPDSSGDRKRKKKNRLSAWLS